MTTLATRMLTDVNVMVAGQGGDGSLTVITLLSRLLAKRGFHLYSARNVASRIKGGHAAALLRGSHVQRGCMGDHLDVLVAFDDEAVMEGGPRLSPDGIVIFDASAGSPSEGYIPAGARVLDIPFARMAVRDLRRDLYKNSLSFGVLTRVLSVPDAEAIETLDTRFARLPQLLRTANHGALENGLAYADEQGLPEGGGPRALAPAEPSDRLLITGNEALSLGFLAAGGRFFTGYPITPASEILEWLTRRLPDFGGIAIQAEDELGAVNMAIGSALTGTRTMTATSGPGISLMQEGVSHLGSAEIPLVIVDSQRSGPSTGMPTKPEQSDLNMVVHGGNGDFPRIVLTPSSPTDCFELGATATNLAQRLQGPVYIVHDQSIAQHAETVEPFDIDVPVEFGKRLTADDLSGIGEYRRYAVTPDGMSPWAVPGTPGGMSLVTGNERNEWGQVSTEAGNRQMMMDKRMRKVDTLRPDLPKGSTWGDPQSEIGLIGIGVTVAPMREAVERLAEAGIAVAGLAPKTLWPVLEETIDFVVSRRRTYIVELNAEGQLAHLIAGVGAPMDRMRNVLRYNGIAFTPGDIVDEIMRGESE